MQAGLSGALSPEAGGRTLKSFLVMLAQGLASLGLHCVACSRGNTAIVSFRTSLNSTVPGSNITKVVTVIVIFIPADGGRRGAGEPMSLQGTWWVWGPGRGRRFSVIQKEPATGSQTCSSQSGPLGPLPGQQNPKPGIPRLLPPGPDSGPGISGTPPGTCLIGQAGEPGKRKG